MSYCGTGCLWGRRILAGFLTWLIPFLASLPFYSPTGTLLVGPMLFDSVMVVVGSLTAAVLMIWFFQVVHAGYTREAVITGVVWFIMNWILDLLVLVGLLGMPLSEYIPNVGLGYLMIPIIVIAAGIIAERAVAGKSG